MASQPCSLPVCYKYWPRSASVTLTPLLPGGWAELWSSQSGRSFHSVVWPDSGEQNRVPRSPRRLWLKPVSSRMLGDRSKLWDISEKENQFLLLPNRFLPSSILNGDRWHFVQSPQCPYQKFIRLRGLVCSCEDPKRALGVNYLVITVLYDGQVEELTAMLLGQDGVHTWCMGTHQLLIGTKVIRWPSSRHKMKTGQRKSAFKQTPTF